MVFQTAIDSMTPSPASSLSYSDKNYAMWCPGAFQQYHTFAWGSQLTVRAQCECVVLKGFGAPSDGSSGAPNCYRLKLCFGNAMPRVVESRGRAYELINRLFSTWWPRANATRSPVGVKMTLPPFEAC